MKKSHLVEGSRNLGRVSAMPHTIVPEHNIEEVVNSTLGDSVPFMFNNGYNTSSNQSAAIKSYFFSKSKEQILKKQV